MNPKSSSKPNRQTSLSKNEEWRTRISSGTNIKSLLEKSISLSLMKTRLLTSWSTPCPTIQQPMAMKLPATTIKGVKIESDVPGARSWRRSTHARSASLLKDIKRLAKHCERPQPQMSKNTKTLTVKYSPLRLRWYSPRPHLSFLHSRNFNSEPTTLTKWSKTYCRNNYSALSVKLGTRNCALRESAQRTKSRRRRC